MDSSSSEDEQFSEASIYRKRIDEAFKEASSRHGFLRDVKTGTEGVRRKIQEYEEKRKSHEEHSRKKMVDDYLALQRTDDLTSVQGSDFIYSSLRYASRTMNLVERQPRNGYWSTYTLSGWRTCSKYLRSLIWMNSTKARWTSGLQR